MINKVVELNENNEMYDEIMNEINSVTEDDLVIIARSEKNRKDDRVKPFLVKNGIYFYVAYELDGKLAFPVEVTPSNIYTAKANMVKRAKIGDMMALVFGAGVSVNEYEYTGSLMVVITLDNKMNGAGLLVCDELLKEIHKKMGDFYIAPSSIHELMLIPTSFGGGKDGIAEIVRTVNGMGDCVTDNEYLSDEVFELGDLI